MRLDPLLSRRNWNLTVGLASVVLVVYIGFLVAANYMSQVKLREAAHEHLIQDTEKRAAAVSYFFSERITELRDVGGNRAISIFFENKALGMSMLYGLRASLMGIQEVFQQFMSEKTVDGVSIYSRIVFIDGAGEPLVSGLAGAGEEVEVDWAEFLNPKGTNVTLMVAPAGDSYDVIISVPYLFKEEYAGQIIAWMSPEPLYKYALKVEDTSSRRILYLASIAGSPLVSSRSRAGLPSLSLQRFGEHVGDMMHYSEEIERGHQTEEVLVCRVPVENTPFYVVSISPTHEVFGPVEPWELPAAMGVLSLFILGWAAVASRTNTRNMVLRARLDEAAKSKRLLEERNEQLIIEIVERKRAEAALRESENQLRDLSSKLLVAQEEERKRIAVELHDSISSSLSAVKFGLANVQEQMARGNVVPDAMESVITVTQHAIDETRRMMTDLRPSILDDLGIVITIGWLCRQFQKVYSNTRIQEWIQVQETDIPNSLKTVLFRITQEAFHNIAKHSNAAFVNLSLVKVNDAIRLTIRDDGVGFDLNTVSFKNHLSKGMGLASMKERAEFSGGSFSIESAPGKGTMIRVSWPCEASKEKNHEHDQTHSA